MRTRRSMRQLVEALGFTDEGRAYFDMDAATRATISTFGALLRAIGGSLSRVSDVLVMSLTDLEEKAKAASKNKAHSQEVKAVLDFCKVGMELTKAIEAALDAINPVHDAIDDIGKAKRDEDAESFMASSPRK